MDKEIRGGYHTYQGFIKDHRILIVWFYVVVVLSLCVEMYRYMTIEKRKLRENLAGLFLVFWKPIKLFVRVTVFSLFLLTFIFGWWFVFFTLSQKIGPSGRLFLQSSYYFVIFVPLYIATIIYMWFLLDGRRKNLGLFQWYQRKFLDYYGLNNSIASNYTLKKFLIEAFDRTYYGKCDINELINDSVSESDNSTKTQPAKSKSIRSYEEGNSKIILAIGAANINTGELEVIPNTTRVVDALLAATAVNPIYPPVIISKRPYIDAVNVGNIPTKVLVKLFDSRRLNDVKCVEIFAVDPLPISKKELGVDRSISNQTYTSLIDIALRALKLQRYRDAKIEHEITKRVTRVIPEPFGTYHIPGRDRPFFRGHVTPIEMEQAVELNRTVLFADKDTKRKEIARTIADGCRAAMQVMFAETVANLWEDPLFKSEFKVEKEEAVFIPCAKVVEKSLSNASNSNPGFNYWDISVCTHEQDEFPGLPEICKHCRAVCGSQSENSALNVVHENCLKFDDPQKLKGKHDWPQEFEDLGSEPIVEQINTDSVKSNDSPNDYEPKQKRAIDTSTQKALLFSGGVFRGVFQVGMLNALGLIGLRPDIVAGASVGSITAAMAANTLVHRPVEEQSVAVNQFSSVFLGMDRIILTDRFADFIRNLTIRASEAKFSLCQADEVFRKFDAGSMRIYQRNVRQVVAGLERISISIRINLMKLSNFQETGKGESYTRS